MASAKAGKFGHGEFTDKFSQYFQETRLWELATTMFLALAWIHINFYAMSDRQALGEEHNGLHLPTSTDEVTSSCDDFHL